MIDPTFEIDKETFDKCVAFAQASADSSADKYARRKQFNLAKIMDDIRNGKLAEEFVYRKLVPQFPDLSPPDFKIYEKKQKSWDPDLKEPKIPLRIAVKSQDIKSEILYGRSWVFQYGNGGKFDCDTGVFKDQDENHYVCLVSMNIPKRIGELRAIVKIKWLHENDLFKPMKRLNLQGNKLAIYYEDLDKFSDQLWQL
jgi:hypothetical protein